MQGEKFKTMTSMLNIQKVCQKFPLEVIIIPKGFSFGNLIENLPL